jgi:hypothetical protein
MDRVLLNPWVSRAGNASFLVGAALFVWRLSRGESVTVVIVALIVAGLVVMVAPGPLRMRSTEAAVADPVPRILFADPSVRHLQLKVFDAGSASVERQSLTIDVRNDPEQNVDAATARAAHPTLTFYTSKGRVVVPSFGGRWANQQDPTGVLASGVLDLLANGKAETVDIAIWSNDGSIYAVNSELINRDPSEWPFLDMELHPTFEEVYVHIQIRGVGLRPSNGSSSSGIPSAQRSATRHRGSLSYARVSVSDFYGNASRPRVDPHLVGRQDEAALRGINSGIPTDRVVREFV